MVRVGGGWMALDEFLVKNDPCRVQHPGLKILRSDSSSSISSPRGRTNLELREKFILPEGASQGLAAFRSRGRRSKPGSRNASPTRSSSSASHSGASLPSAPSTPATPTASASSRVILNAPWGFCVNFYATANSGVIMAVLSRVILQGAASGFKLKRPTFHSSRGSLTGENGGTPHSSKRTGRSFCLLRHFRHTKAAQQWSQTFQDPNNIKEDPQLKDPRVYKEVNPAAET
ncbi:hypothetical protein XENOCAPTIV_026477 [Xenoophorus captivus]|uniref:GAR domain-containing protein n=1 Tax=Xenoophorus captivus TaxID=1517983 RepID=A0ABV0Q3I4_9TELE